MITTRQHIGFSQKLIVLALLATFGQAHAEEATDAAPAAKPESVESVSAVSAEPVASVVKPARLESWLSLGLGRASGDSSTRALYGQYNGQRRNDTHVLLDADVNKHNDETGVWTTLQGRNLGLDNRELRASQKKFGDWKYSAEYSELTRHDPRTINTGLQGAGTTTPTVVKLAAQGAGTDLNPSTKRKSITVDAEKWITSYLQFEASLKNEDKKGERMFGRGITCGALLIVGGAARTSNLCSGGSQGAILLLPEPIDSNTKQLDAKLNLSGGKFLVSGALYWSKYTNAYGSLNPAISGDLWNPNGTNLATTANPGAQLAAFLKQPMALPPDNQARQFSLDGNYVFTPSTRATFKYAKTHATQHENFDSMGLTVHPAGVDDMGGVVDTTLVQLGLTARPMAKLSVLANARSENRDDKTPLQPYSSMLTSTTGPVYTLYTNGADSLKKVTGKLEASYQLPSNYRATLGVDYETVNRGKPESTEKPGGLNLLREETRERGWRAELRRSMSETFNAGISYLNSHRNGSSWLDATIVGTPMLSDAGAATKGGATPYTMMDRQRGKLKLSADWSPNEKLSMQFLIEDGTDRYSEPHLSTLDNAGQKDSKVRLYSADAAFAMSDMWKLTGYMSHGKQGDHVNHNNGAGTAYRAELENTSTAAGIGVRGKPSGQYEVGGDISYLHDNSHYGQLQAATANLPDVTFNQTTLKLFGKYALEKNADIRVDLLRQRTSLNEWTWQYGGKPFFYSDYTTVSMRQTQNVAFAGATYIYKF